MTIWIALLRGINVGGRNIVPMAALRAAFEALGAADVTSYIQSGNIVFRGPADAADAWPARLAAALQAEFDVAPDILMLPRDTLADAVAANPFTQAEADPKSLHLFVLAAPPPAPDLAAIGEIATANERTHLAGRFFYLHAPDGIGRSRLAARAEALLGVPATARNWRTVTKLLDLARALD